MPVIQLHVNREVLNAGQDLWSFIDRVYRAVNDNFSMFGGEDKWDVYPEEIHDSRVIVRVSSTGKYHMADLAMDGDEISLSNVRNVKRQWAVMSSDSGDGDRSESETFDSGETSVVARELDPSLWGSVV